MSATIIAFPALPANDDQLDLSSLMELGDRLLQDVLDTTRLDGFLGLLALWEEGRSISRRCRPSSTR